MIFRDAAVVHFAQVERFESLNALVGNWVKLRIVFNLPTRIGWCALEFDSVAVARSLLGKNLRWHGWIETAWMKLRSGSV